VSLIWFCNTITDWNFNSKAFLVQQGLFVGAQLNRTTEVNFTSRRRRGV